MGGQPRWSRSGAVREHGPEVRHTCKGRDEGSTTLQGRERGRSAPEVYQEDDGKGRISLEEEQ